MLQLWFVNPTEAYIALTPCSRRCTCSTGFNSMFGSGGYRLRNTINAACIVWPDIITNIIHIGIPCLELVKRNAVLLINVITAVSRRDNIPLVALARRSRDRLRCG